MIKKLFRSIMIMVVLIVVLCTSVCSAAVYQSDFPSYCPINGGAWAEITTPQGTATFIVPRDYISSVFGFYGASGNNIINTTNATINGMIYFQNATTYYTNPYSLQCRFTSLNTLEVYVPYSSSYGTRYEWQSLETWEILNTNIGFLDSSGDRQNNAYIYTVSEKLQMIIVCLLIAVLLYYLLGRAWRA